MRLLRSRGIGSGPHETIPDELLERLGLSRDTAEEVVAKVLDAEVLFARIGLAVQPGLNR